MKKNNRDRKEVNLTLETDDLNSLISITNHTQSLMNFTVSQLICRIGSNSIRLSITQLVQKILTLNQKQFLAVKKVLNHAIQVCGKTTVEVRDQMLLYISDEGDVGKSQVIQTIEFGYGLLQQKKEVLLMTFTDNAAYNIDECTIHSILVLGFCNCMQDNINFHTYSLL